MIEKKKKRKKKKKKETKKWFFIHKNLPVDATKSFFTGNDPHLISKILDPHHLDYKAGTLRDLHDTKDRAHRMLLSLRIWQCIQWWWSSSVRHLVNSFR